jgi:prepilin-type processing-associated H-X9-DG protein
MQRRISVIVVLFIVTFAGWLSIVSIQKSRVRAHFRASENNLRQLALFAAHHAHTDPAAGASTTPLEVPAATVVLPGVAPDSRLSWIIQVIPGVDRTWNPVDELIATIDTSQPWASERNQRAARLRLSVVICPENTPPTQPNAPVFTSYVGIAGIGADAATLTIPSTGPIPPRVGAFRYDAPTPFNRITDGLSQTLLMGETADNPGPWLRGGPSTTRGLEDAADAKPLIGTGGQFGGFFPNGANFAMCDGSVRLITPQVTPSVLFELATISGGEIKTLPE